MSSPCCSPSPQPMHMWGGGGALPNERGQRSGTPRSYETEQGILSNSNENNCNDPYEGDAQMPTLYLEGSPSNRSSAEKENFPPSSPNLSYPQPGKMVRLLGKKSYTNNDTDSESEFTEHQKQFGHKPHGKSFLRRAFNNLKSGLPVQQQERLESVLQRIPDSSFFGSAFLLLQLLAILFLAAVLKIFLIGISVGHLNFGLWRCKFQLRSFQRQLLWRMANAKGNDIIIFLGIMLITPWIFLTSLIGFLVSVLFILKESLGTALLQVRLYMFD